MTRSIYLLASSLLSFSAFQASATEMKFKFTSQGEILQILPDNGFKLYDQKGSLLKNIKLQARDPLKRILMHPQGLGMVALNDSKQVLWFDKKLLEQPHYFGD